MLKIFKNLFSTNMKSPNNIQQQEPYYTIDCSETDAFSTQKKLIGLLKKDDLVIFDVGAFVGNISKKYTDLFPESKIHCFEAYPKTYEKLILNVSSYKNIICVNEAISNENSTKVFYVNTATATNSLFPRPLNKRRYYPRYAQPEKEIQVKTTTLDAYVQKYKIKRLDILKIDIQGGELNALKGALSLLAQEKISIIYTEIMFVPHYEGGVLFHELCTLLETYHYTLYNMYHISSAKNGQVRQGDAIFVSRTFRKNYLDLTEEEI